MDSFVAIHGSISQFKQMMPQQKKQKDTKSYLFHRPPNISIHLDYISGFQGYDKRNTVFYINKFAKHSSEPNGYEIVYFVSRVAIIMDLDTQK